MKGMIENEMKCALSCNIISNENGEFIYFIYDVRLMYLNSNFLCVSTQIQTNL